MTIRCLDAHSALIIIDLQSGIVALPTVHPATEVVSRCVFLAETFRRYGLPVVLVNVTGRAPGRTDEKSFSAVPASDWSDLVPELKVQPQDILISKKSWGAFTGTGLEEELRALGVTQVVLAGISTSIGIETTARQAWELGFNVTLATDAMTDTVLAAHENSIQHIFPRLGETGTVATIAAWLKKKTGD